MHAIQVYTESTDGSYLDVKESALVWHYKDADPDFGRWQAKVLHTDNTLELSDWQCQRAYCYWSCVAALLYASHAA